VGDDAPPPTPGSRYLPDDEDDASIKRFSSGCTLLDCSLGGGWARGRVSNIVGDKSTGKTLLAEEACTNLALDITKEFPKAEIHYKETESAFDVEYAKSIGFPFDRADFGQGKGEGPGVLLDTIEELDKDFPKTLEEMDDGQGGIYIVDSLDALTCEAERNPKKNQDGTEKGSYGTEKAKALSEFFRKNIRLIERKQVHLMIISQVRDNIGVTFGRDVTRSGGRALDFYASQVLFIADRGKITKTIQGLERPIGKNIAVKIDKMKVGPPHRDCEFPLMFNFGIDDLRAGVEWLGKLKRLDILGLDQPKETLADEVEAKQKGRQSASGKIVSRYLASVEKMTDAEYRQELANVQKGVKIIWDYYEALFAPKRRKYL
jgi:RecA/RadA recombinase